MLELLFPDLCPSCGSRPGARNTICNKCEEEIDLLEELSVCACCGVPFGYFDSRSALTKDISQEAEHSHLCAKCLKGRYSFKRARSIAIYGGPIREMLHAFKYEGKLKLAQVLAGTMTRHLPYDMEKVDVLVPVPLYIGKLRQREYNQSAVLTANLARRTGVPANLMGLAKIRDTLPQIEIKDEAQRRRNVRGAFQVRDSKTFQGCSVLLIDDVFTTGSTSDECAKTLLKSGALCVEVLTLARARGI
jgi:ComF family protein